MDIFNIPGSRFVSLEDYCDGIIRTEDGCSFRIHRCLLASESKFFKTLLKGDFKGEPRHDQLVHGVSGEAMKTILIYIYTGKADLNQDNLAEVLAASDYLAVLRLLGKCCSATAQLLSPANCFEMLGLTSFLKHLNLHKVSLRYVRTHFSLAVALPGSRIQDLSLQTFLELMSSDLTVDCEDAVWAAIVQWIDAHPEEGCRHISELLLGLRLEDASEALINSILGHPYVANCCETTWMGSWLTRLTQQTSDGSTAKERLLRMVRELYPHVPTASRQPARRFFRSVNVEQLESDGELSYTRTMELSLDDSSLGDDNLWFDVGVLGMPSDGDEENPFKALAIGHTVLVFYTGKIEDMLVEYFIGDCVGFGIDLLTDRHCFPLPILNNRTEVRSVVGVSNAVYCFSGRRMEQGTMECHDLGSDRWDMRVMPQNFEVHAAEAYEGKIYVIGCHIGEPGQRHVIMAAHAYEPQLDTWAAIKRPLLVDSHHRRIWMYAFDGGLFHFDSRNRKVERYDCGRNEWAFTEDLPQELVSPRAAVVNGLLVVSSVRPGKPWSVCWSEVDNGWQKYSVGRYTYRGEELCFCEVVDVEANRRLKSVIESKEAMRF